MVLESSPLDALKLPLLASKGWRSASKTPSTCASPTDRRWSAEIDLDSEPQALATPQQHRTSAPGRLDTFFNLTGAIFGAGILSMPYAFRIAGWATVLVILVTGALTSYTAILIRRCLERALHVIPSKERRGEPSDWPLIGYAACGPTGRRLVNGVFLGEIFFILMAFLVVNGSNAQLLLPSVSRSVLISSSGLISFVLLFFPFSLFSYFSVVGHIAMGATIALMVVSGLMLPELPQTSDYLGVRWQGLPQAVGICIFCNVAHGTIPSIYVPCGCKKQFDWLTRTSWSVVALVYVLTGATGYMFFGAASQQNVVINLGRDLSQTPLAGLEWMPSIAAMGFVVKLQTSFPIYATPIVNSVEAAFGLSRHPMHSPSRVLLRAAVMFSTTVLAVLMQDNMADCIALTGSLLSMCTSMIFPSTFYFLLFRRELSLATLLLLAGTCAIGLYFQITGTRDSLLKISGAA